MLKLNNVVISVQDIGSVLGVFLQGKKEDIERRFFSFWNHEATSAELEYWCDECAMFFVGPDQREAAERKLLKAFCRGVYAELTNAKHPEGFATWRKAVDVGWERFDAAERVRWYMPVTGYDIYNMGVVAAEKGTGNFDDDVLGETIRKSNTHTND